MSSDLAPVHSKSSKADNTTNMNVTEAESMEETFIMNTTEAPCNIVETQNEPQQNEANNNTENPLDRNSMRHTGSGGYVEISTLKIEDKEVIIHKYMELKDKLQHAEQEKNIQMEEVQKELTAERMKSKQYEKDLQDEIGIRREAILLRDRSNEENQLLTDEIRTLKTDNDNLHLKLQDLDNELKDRCLILEKCSEESHRKDDQLERSNEKCQILTDEIETLKTDHDNLHLKVQELDNELEAKCVLLEKCSEESQRKADQLDRMQKHLDTKEQELQTMVGKLHMMQNAITMNEHQYQGHIHDLRVELGDSRSIIDEVKKENEELSERLSEEWSKKLASDESDIENISIKSRPLNIASEYENLYSTEWLEAKMELDNGEEITEDCKAKLLCEILKFAERTANIKYDEVMRNILQKVNKPLSLKEQAIQTENKQYEEQTTLEEPVSDEDESDTKAGADKEAEKKKGVQDFQDSTKEDLHTGDGNHIKESTIVDIQYKSTMDSDKEDDQKTEMEEHSILSRLKDEVSRGADTKLLASNALGNNHGEKNIDGNEEMNENNDTCKNPDDHTNDIATNSELEKIVADALCMYTESEHEYPKEGINIPKQLANVVGDMFRVNSDRVDTHEIQMIVMTYIRHKSLHKASTTEALNKYVTACAKLAWKMSIQRPKMLFKTEGVGKQWAENLQEPVFGSYNPSDPNAVVAFYQTPALYHADKLMVKGRVITKNQPKHD